MKQVRELKTWIEGCEEWNALWATSACCGDFGKEGEATEAEVDAQYAKTLKRWRPGTEEHAQRRRTP